MKNGVFDTLVCHVCRGMSCSASRRRPRPDIKFGVAAEPYPPFTSKDASGKWVGWEIDLMNASAQQMNEKCELVEVAWDGIIPALTSKQIDVIWSSMSITDERKKTIDFTDMYYDTAAAIIGAKNGDTDITPEHLKGKTIGVQVSTTHERYVAEVFRRRTRRSRPIRRRTKPTTTSPPAVSTMSRPTARRSTPS